MEDLAIRRGTVVIVMAAEYDGLVPESGIAAFEKSGYISGDGATPLPVHHAQFGLGLGYGERGVVQIPVDRRLQSARLLAGCGNQIRRHLVADGKQRDVNLIAFDRL